MRTLWKNLGWGLIPVLALAPLSGYSLELNAVQSAVSNAKQAADGSQACPSQLPNDISQCQLCTNHLIQTYNKLKEDVDKAMVAYGGSTVAGGAAVGAAADKGLAQAGQKTQTSGGQGVKNSGNQGQQARAASAGSAAQAFKDCAGTAEGGACSGAKNSNFATQLKDACSQGDQIAEAVKKEKEASGSSMGDMASMLGQAAQALGPLAQMLAGQQQTPTTTPSSTSPSSVSKPAQVSSAKLSDGSSTLAGGAVDFGGGATTEVAKGTNAASGYAPGFEAQNFAPDPSLAEALGGTNPGSTGGGGAFSASGASSAGGGFGGKSGDSSGASKMGDKTAGILDPGNFEIGGGGGGGGGKPFLGLKSKSSELADLTSGDAGADVLGEGGFDEGGRDLASSDQLGSDIHSEDGGTLFDAVRSKYSEIKKRGNI
jgi:hypothetical protein